MRKASIKNKLIALWLIPGLGPRRFRNLLDYFGEIDKIFTAPPRDISKITGLDQKSAELIPTALDSKRFNDELQLIEKYKIKVVDYTEDIYPNLLHEIYDAPPILYVKGEFDFNNGIPIAFVGSRKASFYGKSMCQKIIKKLAELNKDIVIVSGLAIGIDSTAHKTALEMGLRTVGVLAGGLSSIYPAQNKNLSEKIASSGALLTEFPIATKPIATNFHLRNRIISGLSRGSVVIEAGKRSGALITARFTTEQNRELFALPGLADSRFYIGTNRLIQRGQAKLIMDAEDILEEIMPTTGQQTAFNDQPESSSETEDMTGEEAEVLKILRQENVHQDVIAQRLQIPVHKLMAILTKLELEGKIVSKSGSIYESVSN
jgi:DNA processing protein